MLIKKKIYLPTLVASFIAAMSGAGCKEDSHGATEADVVDPPFGHHDEPPPPPPGDEPRVDVERIGQEGTRAEAVHALENPKDDAPVFVVVRAGTKLDAEHVVVEGEEPVGRATRIERGPQGETIIVELLRGGADVEVRLTLDDVRYLKTLDLAYLGQETQRVTGIAVTEIDDFDLDEQTRRAGEPQLLPPSQANALAPAAGGGDAADFDCIARFARISPSRDFLPFPLSNCSAPQDPVGDPERIADAVQAKKVAQNIFNQQTVAYNNARAMIASLQARLVAIQNAYIFIRHDPHFKEYNILHFKNFIHGRKSYNDRYKRAEALLVAAAHATQSQIAAYSQVPPPNANVARSDANRIVAKKWNCVLKQGLLNNGGRSGTTIVGVTLETVGAPFVDVQIMLDDHPPLPQKDGWGGLFDINVTPNLPTDVTRLPVDKLVPVTASVGLPIVMFRFQPLDAKKTRPVGKACNLRAGIVQ